MSKKTLYISLVNIYTDYFDGLYNDGQLKFMLRKIHNDHPEININEYAQLCLDAQWENASERDYEVTKKINEKQSDQ